MNLTPSLLLTSLLALPLLSTAQAAPAQALSERFNTVGLGVALGGYDPVSYFPEGGGKPAKGFVKRDYRHDGVTYRFASDANLARFRAAPEKYLPAYNGWCAWAMAELNAKVDVEPTAYEVYQGKLYVFYDHADLDTHALWRKDPAGMVAKADANWQAHKR